MDAVILNGNTPTAGNPLPLGMPRINMPKTGLDSLVQEYLLAATLATLPAEIALSLPRGMVHPDLPEMWLEDVAPSSGEGGLFKVTATYKGRILDKPFYTKFSGNVAQSSTDSQAISVPLYPPTDYPDGVAKVTWLENTPTWSVSYLHTVRPSTIHFGQSIGLGENPSSVTLFTDLKPGYPAAPEPPPGFPGDITDPTFSVPAGWALVNRDIEEVLNADGEFAMAAITDHWQWYHYKKLSS